MAQYREREKSEVTRTEVESRDLILSFGKGFNHATVPGRRRIMIVASRGGPELPINQLFWGRWGMGKIS